MLTREQFKAAKMIVEVKDNEDFDWVEELTYEVYQLLPKALEDAKFGAVVCVKDPSHDIEIWTRGTRTVSSKTGEEVDSSYDDEVWTCTACKGEEGRVISDGELDEFEALVAVKAEL